MIPPSRSPRRQTLATRTALVILGVVSMFTSIQRAQAINAPTFFNNYFLTGDYLVNGVGLKGTGVQGFATNTIAVSGVPADATPIAAFLYWGTVAAASDPGAGLAGAQFKGHDIAPFTVTLNPTGTSPCWSSGGGTGGGGESKRFFIRRADVLRFFALD